MLLKKSLFILCTCTFLLLTLPINVMGAIHSEDDFSLYANNSDSWYTLDLQGKRYKTYYHSEADTSGFGSEFYLNQHSFVSIYNKASLSNSFKASTLLPIGVIAGIEVDLATEDFYQIFSLGYCFKLHSNGYISLTFDYGNPGFNGFSTGYDIDWFYLANNYRLSGELYFYDINDPSVKLCGRLAINDTLTTGMDLNNNNDDYSIGLTWLPVSYIISNGKVGVFTGEFYYSLGGILQISKFGLGVEYEKNIADYQGYIKYKGKYQIDETSQFIIKSIPDAPDHPNFTVIYQMNF